MKPLRVVLSFSCLLLCGCPDQPLDGHGDVIIVCPMQLTSGSPWCLEVLDPGEEQLLCTVSGSPEAVPMLYMTDMLMTFHLRDDNEASVYLGDISLKLTSGPVTYRLASTGATCRRVAGGDNVYLCALTVDKFQRFDKGPLEPHGKMPVDPSGVKPDTPMEKSPQE